MAIWNGGSITVNGKQYSTRYSGADYQYTYIKEQTVDFTGYNSSDGSDGPQTINRHGSYHLMDFNPGSSYPYLLGDGNDWTCWVDRFFFPAYSTIRYCKNDNSGIETDIGYYRPEFDNANSYYYFPTNVESELGSHWEKKGYALKGWCEAGGDLNPWPPGCGINDNALYEWCFTDYYGGTAPKYIYALWTANSYTIKYNANGGTGTVSDQSATYDTSVTLSSNGFTKTGYHFAGWGRDANTVSYSAGQSVSNLAYSGSVTLYAIWALNTYTVVFDGNGSTSGSTGSQTATYGQGFTLNSCGFTKNGYSFYGWARSSSGSVVYTNNAVIPDGVENSLTSINGETVTLYAVWKQNAATINGIKYLCEDDGSSSASDHSTTFWNSRYLSTATSAFSAEDANGNGKRITPPSNGYRLYIYDLTYTNKNAARAVGLSAYRADIFLKDNSKYDDGSYIYPRASMTVCYHRNNDLYDTATVNKTYYYNPEVGSSGLTGNKFPSSNVRLEFESGWERAGYHVVGYTEPVEDLNITPSSNIDNYRIVDWGGWSSVTYPKAPSVAPIDIYLKWVGNSYQVRYEGNGATGGSTATSTHTYGDYGLLTLNGFVKNGYEFIGWATTPNGDIEYADRANVKNLTSTEGGVITLYAQWQTVAGWQGCEIFVCVGGERWVSV